MTAADIPEHFAARVKEGAPAQMTANGATWFVHRRGEELIVTDSPDAPVAGIPVTEKPDPMATLGPQLWRELFNYRGILGGSPSAREALLRSVEERLPPGCACRPHWRKWKLDNPPDFSTAEAFDAWLLRGLNAVRARQGKERISLEGAREKYGQETAV